MNFKTVLLGLVMALGIGVILLVSRDDDSLDPAVERALRPPKRLPLESNLFYPLTGFAVAVDKIPAEEGYAAVTRVNEILRSHVSGKTEEMRPEIQKAWVESVLDINDPTKIVCALRKDGCIAALLARRTDLLTLAGQHQILTARYRGLANFPEFQLDLLPHVEMPLPRFNAVLSTHRLVLGVQIVGYLQGEDEKLSAVLQDLQFLRRLLGQADNVLTKMVATAMMADALHAYAAMMDRKGSNIERFPVLAPLSTAELSPERSLMGEFRFVASALSGFQGEPADYEVLGKDLGLPPWLGATALRALFKPNRTLNRDFPCWQAALAMTRRPAAELMAQGGARDTPACKPDWYEWILNPIGMVLSSISGPDFRRYAGRLHDLDGLITLVNLKRALRRDRVTADDVADYLSGNGAMYVDPYAKKSMQWDSETRTLRFTGAQSRIGYDRLPLEPLQQETGIGR